MGDEKDPPPVYSANEASSSSRSEPVPLQSPRPDFSLYGIPKSVMVTATERMVTDPDLCNDPQALARFCEIQLSLPPLPLVRIRSRLRAPSTFDITLDLLPLIYRPAPVAWNYITVLNKGEDEFRSDATHSRQLEVSPELLEWIRIFCEDPAPLKRSSPISRSQLDNEVLG